MVAYRGLAPVVFLLIAGLVSGCRTIAGGDRPPYISYRSDEVTLGGVIERRVYPGPPNYEAISQGDEEQFVWILLLARPVYVKEGSTEEGMNEPGVPDLREVQLVLRSAQYNAYRDYVGQPVVARGSIFGGYTGHHRTEVLLDVESIVRKGTGNE